MRSFGRANAPTIRAIGDGLHEHSNLSVERRRGGSQLGLRRATGSPPLAIYLSVLSTTLFITSVFVLKGLGRAVELEELCLVPAINAVTWVVHGLALVRAAGAFYAVVDRARTIPVIERAGRYKIVQIFFGVGLAYGILAWLAHAHADLIGVLNPNGVRWPVVIVINAARIRRIWPVLVILPLQEFFDLSGHITADIWWVVVVFGGVQRHAVADGVHL